MKCVAKEFIEVGRLVANGTNGVGSYKSAF
jgi:hypothetical protein